MEVVFWKKKSGPLPNWAWGGLVLGGAVAYSSWRRNKAQAAEDEEGPESGGMVLPENLPPTYVFQDNNYFTWPSVPPGGGRPPTGPGGADPSKPSPPKPKPGDTKPSPAKPRPGDTPPSPPGPVDKPPAKPKPGNTPPKPPQGKYVTVAKWTKGNPPWNSTIWGITQKLLGPKAQWKAVWEAPQNASLRKKRKDPERIQPGDRVWVPGAK